MSKKKIHAYISSDYIGFDNGKHKFYYGYESTFCPLHGKDVSLDDCCEKQEWCFVVKVDGKEAVRYTDTELKNTCDRDPSNLVEFFIAGVAKYLKDMVK